MKCSKCGTEYESGVCPNCGTYNDPLNLKRRREKSNKNIVLIVVFSICVVIAAAAVLSGVLDLLNANGIDVQSAMNPDTSSSESEINTKPESGADKVNLIFDKIGQSGIDISGLDVYSVDEDPSAMGLPVDYIYSGAFDEERLASITSDYRAGKILLFGSEDMARAWADKLQDDEKGENFYGYKIQNGNFLVLVNSLYTSGFAEEYANAVGGTLLYVPTDAEKQFVHKDASNTVGLKSEDATLEPARKEAYIRKCQSISYEELARNPLSYVGNDIRLRGNVMQVQELGNEVIFLLQVTQDEWGFWEDNVYLTYTRKSVEEPHVLESDIINVYGPFAGQYTYTSVMGQAITVPSMEVKYLSIE